MEIETINSHANLLMINPVMHSLVTVEYRWQNLALFGSSNNVLRQQDLSISLSTKLVYKNFDFKTGTAKFNFILSLLWIGNETKARAWRNVI